MFVFVSAPPSTAGHKVGIAILVIVIIFLVMVIVVIFVRRVSRRRRLGQFKQSGEGGVNFSPLEDEPDVRFGHGDRKLHFMGSTSSS